MNRNIEILKKFVGEQNQRIQNDISKQGYKDNSPYRNNPFNIIQGTPQGTPITMKGVSTPLMGMDEFGNRQYMQPGQEYQFPGSQVKETPAARYGGLLNKTITCQNCGWSWKAADGGNDVTTCHECGHVNKLMQTGVQFQNGGLIKPVQKNYKTLGQYKAALKTYNLNLHKEELANNPEKIKGESDKNYENRTKYFDFKVRQEEDKYPVSKAYLEMKDDQNADSNAISRTLRQIATSPAHVAYNIYNAANPHGLDKYKSRATKNNEDLDLFNSIGDASALLTPFDYGLKASPLWKQVATRTVKEIAEDEEFNLAKSANKWINSFQMGGAGMMYADRNYQFAGKVKNERDLTFAKKDVIPNFQPKIGIPLTAKQIEQKRVQELIDKQGTIKSYTPQSTVSRVSEVALNPLTAFGYAARNESLPENFSRGQRNALDSAVDIVNPAFYLNQGAKAVSNTSNAINNVAQGNLPAAYRDIKNAGMNTLNVLPLISEYKTLGRVANNVGKVLGTEEGLLNNLSKSRSINEVKGSLIGIPPEKALPRLSPEELKIYRQVQDIGRMRATGKPISEQYKYALDQGIPEKHLQQIFEKSKSEIESAIPFIEEQETFRLANPIRERINLQRSPRTTSSDQIIDEMNSSMPRQNRNNVIRHTLSDYGSNSDIEQLLERVSNNQLPPVSEEFILNTGSTRGRILIPGQRSEMTLGESFNAKNADTQRNAYNTLKSIKNKIAANSQNYPYYNGPVLENVPSLSLSGSGSLKNVSNKVTGQSVSGINSGDIFTGSLNTSHSSYLPQLKQIFKYDKGLPQFLGYKPMNHMGFLSDYHYPSKDIAKYLNTEIDTQISRGIIPKDIQRPYAKGDKVLLPHYAIKQKKTGGSITTKQNKVLGWINS